MNTNEVLKLALEALGLYARTLAPTETQKKGMKAITALDEALAQPQQEPAATAYFEKITGRIVPPDDTHRRKFPMCYRPLVFGDTSPPAQEFVCSTGLCHYRKPLTDEEIENIAAQTLFPIDFARAIEAAHGIKENS